MRCEQHAQAANEREQCNELSQVSKRSQFLGIGPEIPDVNQQGNRD